MRPKREGPPVSERIAVILMDDAGEPIGVAMCDRWLEAIKLREDAERAGIAAERIMVAQVREFRTGVAA